VRCNFVEEPLAVGSGRDGAVWCISRVERRSRVLVESWAEKYPKHGQSLSTEISLLKLLLPHQGKPGWEHVVHFRKELPAGGYSVSAITVHV
jgi:hypothetical protein